DSRHRVDRRGDRGWVASGVGQGLPGRVGSEIDGRAPTVAGIAEALGGLPDPHDDRGAGIQVRLAHEFSPSLARSRIVCSHSATIWGVIAPAGRICPNEPTTWPTKNDSRRSAPS